jgi:hypothetical protein
MIDDNKTKLFLQALSFVSILAMLSFAKCDTNNVQNDAAFDGFEQIEIEDYSQTDNFEVDNYNETSAADYNENIVNEEQTDTSCEINTFYFWDCSSCPDGRELSPTGRVYRFNRWSYHSKNYLLVSNYTSVNIYNITIPENPELELEGGAYYPWGLIEGSPDDDTEQWDMALAPDNIYGLSMFQNFGWVTFGIVLNNQEKVVSFETYYRYRITPPVYIPSNRGARNAAVFSLNNGKLYGAAAYLAQENSTGGIDIAEISDPLNPRFLTTLPDTSANGLIRIFSSPDRVYLITTSLMRGNLLIYDVSDPSNPILSSSITLCDTNSQSGILDFDLSQNRVFVIYRPQREAIVNAAVYEISNPSNPQRIFLVDNMNWQYNNITGIQEFVIIGSSANETADLPVYVYNINFPESPLLITITPPNNDWFQETELDITAAATETSLIFYRAAFIRASTTIIKKSCFN